MEYLLGQLGCTLNQIASEFKMTKLLIFSGAGLSAESGIPTFREDPEGLWSRFDPNIYSNYQTWRQNFETVHGFHSDLREKMREFQPNLAHKKIAEWQRKYNAEVITQNGDILLEQAGCINVIHVHGRLDEMQCENCGHVWNIGFTRYNCAQGCPQCQSVQDVKPGVVLFGESAPRYADLYTALESLTPKSLFLCIGTAGSVVPVDKFARVLECPSVINVLNLNRDIDGYLPPIVPAHWTHCILGPITQQLDKIEHILQKHLGF